MNISYMDLVEAEREGQMAVCVKVAEAIRSLKSENFSSIQEALDAAAGILGGVRHNASTDAGRLSRPAACSPLVSGADPQWLNASLLQ